ncbi:MAG: dinitrogenase iron-molybdenum cofactor biosynthesis protein [Elusimicrobia bacterium]|nr:dinitrogenase iron-molybdenum cofactor biosynthesis protein [Elusimicrobiota bacterium]
MKVCITASGPQMSDPSDPRFGRCSYFVFLDLATKSVEAVANPNLEAAGGAGIRSAELVASREVAAVITGHVGPNAFRTLEAAGIPVFIGARGTVNEAAAAYEEGRLQKAEAPDSGSKSGMRP